MARKSNVKPLILEVWEKNIDKAPKEIRDIVIEKLGQKRSKSGAYPGPRLVQQYIHDFREKYGQITGEDKPWHISTLQDSPIPSDALPKALEILFTKLREKPPTHITIRDAKWIGRLSKTIEDNSLLFKWAHYYADAERIQKLTGFDVTNIVQDARLYQEMGGQESMAVDFTGYILKQAREAEGFKEFES